MPTERTARRQDRQCLKAGASHKLLASAGHPKCWRCGRWLKPDISIGEYADFVNFSDIADDFALIQHDVMAEMIQRAANSVTSQMAAQLDAELTASQSPPVT